MDNLEYLHNYTANMLHYFQVGSKEWRKVTVFAVGVSHVVCGPLTVIVWVSGSWVDSNVLTPVHLKWIASSALLSSSSSWIVTHLLRLYPLTLYHHSKDFLIWLSDSPSPLSPGFVDLFVSCSWFLCWHNSLPCTWQSSHWRYLWLLFTHRYQEHMKYNTNKKTHCSHSYHWKLLFKSIIHIAAHTVNMNTKLKKTCIL